MRGPVNKCCGLRVWAISICCLYLAIHTGLLLVNFFILNNPETHVDNVVRFLDTNDNRLINSRIYRQTRQYLIQNSGEYLALPITVNAVFIVSNVLAGFGVICSTSLLLLPWILGYLLYIMFASSLLVYLIILLPDIWFKVLLFLVVAPMIIVAAAFWIVVVRLFVLLRKKGKTVKVSGVPVPATVYTPEPHTWDTPLPIWALQPPTSAWDPSYLQQIDPRYLETPQQSRATTRSRKSSSRSRSKSGDSQVSYRERQSDSVSLSDKYGGDVYETDRRTDRQSSIERTSYSDEWDTTREDEYTEDERRSRRGGTGNPAFSQEETQSRDYSTDHRNTEVEIASEEGTEVEEEEEGSSSRSYRQKRPKSRAESSVSLSDKYGTNSTEKYSQVGAQDEMVVNFNRNYFQE